MKRFVSALNDKFFGLLGFVLALAIVALLFYLLYWVMATLLSLSEKERAPILAAMLTVIGSIVVLLVAKSHERSKQVDEERRGKLAEVYAECLEVLFAKLSEMSEARSEQQKKKIVNEINKWLRQSMLWGSDQFVKQLSVTLEGIRVMAETNAPFTDDGFRAMFGTLVLTMRKDLGHKNQVLTEDDVLTLMIADWHHHKAPRELPESSKQP
jgi:hypothetical protein